MLSWLLREQVSKDGKHNLCIQIKLAAVLLAKLILIVAVEEGHGGRGTPLGGPGPSSAPTVSAPSQPRSSRLPRGPINGLLASGYPPPQLAKLPEFREAQGLELALPPLEGLLGDTQFPANNSDFSSVLGLFRRADGLFLCILT